MTWVAAWNSTSQVQITDALLHNIPLWRSFSYYVNPLSTSQTELGTKQHPYKDINYALAEIFNFHKNSNRSISLYIMEYTTNYLMTNSYVSNMTLLTIEPYSISGTSTNKAKIVGIDSTTKIINPSMPTKMSINPSLTLVGTDGLPSGGTLLYVVNSGLTMRNLLLSSDYLNSFSTTWWFNCVYVGTKTVTLTNIDFKSQGKILQSTFQLNLYFENVDIDMYRNTGGIYLFFIWMYPVPVYNSLLYFNNMTMYFSQDRAKNLQFANSAFSHFGDGDIVMNNVTINLYSLASDTAFGIALYAVKPWNASSTDIRYYNLTNVYMTTFPSLIYDRTSYFTSFLWIMNGGSAGSTFVKLENMTFENMLNLYYSPIYILLDSNINVELTNIVFRNIESSTNLLQVFKSNKISVSNIEVINWTFTSYASIVFTSLNIASFNTFTLKNVYGYKISNKEFFKLTSIQNGLISMQNLSIIDSKFSDSISTISIDSATGSNISVNNLSFLNVTISNKVSLLSLGATTQLAMNNLTFTQIYPLDSNEVSNMMINLEAISSKTDSNISLSNIKVSNSSVSFIKISNSLQSESINQHITIKQLEYSNCSFNSYDSLIATESVISSATFLMTFSELNFKNINFKLGGDLFLLKHQSNEDLVIRNSVFNNISFGGFKISSFYNTNSSNKTLVNVSNSTFNNIDAYFKSLFELKVGGELKINNSSISKVSNLNSGSIISTENKATAIIIKTVSIQLKHIINMEIDLIAGGRIPTSTS